MEPQYGSGPDKDGNEQNGYITVDEYDDILSFAAKRNIQIITEINGPGHARAAILSMMKRGKVEDFLHDENQTVFDVPSGKWIELHH